MKKSQYYLRIYIDSSYQPKEKKAYCCFYFEGILKEKINYSEVFSLGDVKDSAFSEYLGVEKTLSKLESFLIKKRTSKHKVEITIYTDLQTLPRQFKKWIPPPLDPRISSCFSRICHFLSNYCKADIFWIERKENIAGRMLEKSIKKDFIEKSENKTDNKVYFSDLF